MRVALTGATGFLGLRLVRELLCVYDSLTILAHAGSGSALGRITRFMELSGAPDALVEALPGRLHVVETDLSRPLLGLAPAEYRRLADELDVIWHSAGNINLDDDLASLRRTNVDGTRHVLELAAAGAGRPLVHHIGTAFVGGARRDGVVYEDELDDRHGFENNYERSKYEAEVLVRDWSRRHGRPVVVMRPSVLVTDMPPHPELPPHPLRFLARIVEASLPGGGSAEGEPPPEHRPVVRLAGHPLGHLNLMPVEHAAAVMVRLAGLPPSGGADVYHVVHDHDVASTVLTALVERIAPVRVRLVDSRPDDPAPLEAAVDLYPGFTPYLSHRRRFDDTRVRSLLGPLPSGIRVGLDYLVDGVAPRTASTTGAP
ncbi:SDR family oxidoreductase [Streptomyces sp. NPDC056796]|uniref:SDR family oxidoreductase n=1 Tax=Streptomyces sp. NPDC056796 TaxID=3345947 RepID=UPI00369F3F26